MGKNSFKYSWIADRMKKERECDVVIDIDIPSWQFEINKNDITLIDGPGFRNFIKHMITSISLVCFIILDFDFIYSILFSRLIVLYY